MKNEKQQRQKKTKNGQGKEYSSPQLKRYGNLKKLTNSAMANVMDGITRAIGSC